MSGAVVVFFVRRAGRRVWFEARSLGGRKKGVAVGIRARAEEEEAAKSSGGGKARIDILVLSQAPFKPFQPRDGECDQGRFVVAVMC